MEAASKWKPKPSKPTLYEEAAQAAVSFCKLFDYLFVGAARAVNNDPDIMTWDEAMRSPYRDEFLKAAQSEITELEDKQTWFEDKKEHAVNGVIPKQSLC